ncbi:MAG: TolC family outer membrane protein [Pseudomonadota bacterium]
MKTNIKFTVIPVIAMAMLLPTAASADSLLDIYQQALQSDPLIHEAEARRLAALEAEPQARGLLLPQINASGSFTTSDDAGTNVQADDQGNFGTFSSLTESDTTQWQVQLRQTLFRWDQIVGLRRADKVVARAETDREAAQQDLIVRVTQRYLDVLAAEDRLIANNANKQAIARQLEQAKQRFDVGLIAITDVQESQAAFDESVANEIAAKRSLATAREFLREITGTYIRELSAPTDEFPLSSPQPAAAEDWVQLSMSQNLALVGARLDEELARDQISLQRNGHYPTLDLVVSTGNRTTESDRSVDGSPFFPTEGDNDSDSISLQLNVPLFAGGATSSRVKQAIYEHRAERERLQRVTRETERQARDAYLGVLAEISRVKALEQAVASSRTALEATEAGFDVGTRTIVDVLNSQFQLYNSIVNFRQARYDYILNMMRLKQAAGSLQVQDLERLDQFLEARKPPEDQFAEAEEAASETQ